ncbi:MAG: hypothetical protein IPK28_21675 [Devosia sp.]|nr:hypothetical protein [Devosia sp.]
MPSNLPQGAVPAAPMRYARTIAFGAGFLSLLAVLMVVGNMVSKVPAL